MRVEHGLLRKQHVLHSGNSHGLSRVAGAAALGCRLTSPPLREYVGVFETSVSTRREPALDRRFHSPAANVIVPMPDVAEAAAAPSAAMML